MSSGLKKKQGKSDSTVAAYDALPQYLCRIGARMCWVKKKKSPKAVCFPISSSERTADGILKHVKKEVDDTAPKVTNVDSVDGTEKRPYFFE